ncbi:hypothetical protein B0H19DRAFT_1167844 [Mycena capillaripes]|nr:hypothetical protein B0H19DRAFT_1167844 [Mycena capillaripes]
MTSGAKKEKARKKKRELKLLEAEQQRIEEERTQRAPVSILTQPPFDPSTPTLVDNGDSADTLIPHAVHVIQAVPAAPLPAVDATRPYYSPSFRFPEHWLDENIPVPPSQWPAHIREYIYGPSSPKSSSWADDIPEPAALMAVVSIACAPRDWATLCSVSAHPWRAIRRRKRRLRADYWERPTLHYEAAPPPNVLLTPPQLTPLAPLLEGRSHVRPADLLGFVPLHIDDPIHPDEVPPDDLPAPSLCLFPDDHPPSEFPVETEYGPVAHQLAHACSRALPPALDAAGHLCDVVWPPLIHPDGRVSPNPEARLDLLARLSPDHLVFLCAIAHMGHLDHHLALLFDPAITEFAHLWVHHCELMGEAG